MSVPRVPEQAAHLPQCFLSCRGGRAPPLPLRKKDSTDRTPSTPPGMAQRWSPCPPPPPFPGSDTEGIRASSRVGPRFSGPLAIPGPSRRCPGAQRRTRHRVRTDLALVKKDADSTSSTGGGGRGDGRSQRFAGIRRPFWGSQAVQRAGCVVLEGLRRGSMGSAAGALDPCLVGCQGLSGGTGRGADVISEGAARTPAFLQVSRGRAPTRQNMGPGSRSRATWGLGAPHAHRGLMDAAARTCPGALCAPPSRGVG